jgi:hypothetical protein
MKRTGIHYDETKFSCAYLRLHCFSGKFIRKATCHATETGIQSFLETIFHRATDADDAAKFINNHNLTMLVTRRTYSNPSAYTNDVVALLSWTSRNKPVVYIGWAAVSGGQFGAAKVALPSPLVDSQSAEYGLPDRTGLPNPLPAQFTGMGLMTVMFELMEGATCRYKKIKSRYMYLHVNPNESATDTSPHPFWTKHGFDPVNETLVITPLAVTDDANPVLRNQQALKDLSQTDKEILAQAEILAGVKELRAHFIIHPQDGLKTDNDKGMVIYSRMHTKECTVVHTLTDKVRDAILAEAARKAQEAQAQPAGGDGKPPVKPPDNDEGRPPDDDRAKKPPEGKPPGDDATEKEEAETKQKAAEIREQDAKDQYIKANEDVYEAKTALKKAQATCTKTSKAVELAHKRIKAAEKGKTKADKVHADSFLQLDVLGQAVDAANSLVAEAENSKTSGIELETLTMNATMAESLQSGYAPQVEHNAITKKGAATALINRQAEVVPLLAVAAEADTAMQLAATQGETATAAKEVALQALTKLGLKPNEEEISDDDETGQVPPTVAATAKL